MRRSVLRKISPRVSVWSEIHGAARNEPYPWNSYVIHIPEEGALALVDPLPMAEEEVEELERIGTPTHILLTCEYHLRASETYRERWGCKLLANEAEADRYEVRLDGTFRDRQRLWGAIDLIFVPGNYYPETALLVREGGGVLIIGDLLSGGRKDCGIPEGELGLAFPDYVEDLAGSRRSMARLLEADYEDACFGHGTPIRERPKEKLRAYVESDDVWARLAAVRRDRRKK